MASSTCSAIPAAVSSTSGVVVQLRRDRPRCMAVRLEQHKRGLSAWLGLAAMLGVLGGTATVTAAESTPDYRLELAEQPIKSGKTLIVQIRLMHVPDGGAVTNATVTVLRFDMGPDGMAAMSAQAKGAISPKPGIYAFETWPSMPGNWALRLRATLPDHAPVELALVVVAPK
jgi:YtkA-like